MYIQLISISISTYNSFSAYRIVIKNNSIIFKMKKFVLVAAFAALISSALSHDVQPNPELQFACSMFKKLAEAKKRENILFSPHNTYRILVLFFFGADGDTKKSLEETLQLDQIGSEEELRRAYIIDEPELKKKKKHGFCSAGTIFVQEGSHLTEYTFLKS